MDWVVALVRPEAARPIPAHAIALDVVLVTNNRREFIRDYGLRLENWV